MTVSLPYILIFSFPLFAGHQHLPRLTALIGANNAALFQRIHQPCGPVKADPVSPLHHTDAGFLFIHHQADRILQIFIDFILDASHFLRGRTGFEHIRQVRIVGAGAVLLDIFNHILHFLVGNKGALNSHRTVRSDGSV